MFWLRSVVGGGQQASGEDEEALRSSPLDDDLRRAGLAASVLEGTDGASLSLEIGIRSRGASGGLDALVGVQDLAGRAVGGERAEASQLMSAGGMAQEIDAYQEVTARL